MTSRAEIEFQTRRIKECVDITAVIRGYVRLRKAGREFVGLCPFHAEKTPSFHVNPERRSWRCFGCSSAGDIFDFITQIEHVDFTEARKLLADRTGIPVVSRKLTEAERRDWLRQRKQDEADAERRDALTESLRTKRKTYFQAFHRAKRHIITHGTDSPGCEFYMTAAETYETRYLALDREIDKIEGLPLHEFRKLLTEKASEVAA